MLLARNAPTARIVAMLDAGVSICLRESPARLVAGHMVARRRRGGPRRRPALERMRRSQPTGVTPRPISRDSWSTVLRRGGTGHRGAREPMRAGRGIRTAAVLMTGLVGARRARAGDRVRRRHDTAGDRVHGRSGPERRRDGVRAGDQRLVVADAPRLPRRPRHPRPSPRPRRRAVPQPARRRSRAPRRRAGIPSGTGMSSGATSPGSVPSRSGGPEVAPSGPTTPAAKDAPAVVAPADTVASVSDAASSLAGTTVPGTTIPEVLQNLPDRQPHRPGHDPDAAVERRVRRRPGRVPLPGQQGQRADRLGGGPSVGSSPSFCGALPTTSTASLTDLITAADEPAEVAAGHPDAGADHTVPPRSTPRGATCPRRSTTSTAPSSPTTRPRRSSRTTPPTRTTSTATTTASPASATRATTATVCDDYSGYPVGAVATGDSAPVVDPRVAAALGGLGLAAVAGATVDPPRGAATTREDAPGRHLDARRRRRPADRRGALTCRRRERSSAGPTGPRHAPAGSPRSSRW